MASPSLRVLSFSYPVNAYFQTVIQRGEEHDEALPWPQAAANVILVFRNPLALWRMEVPPRMQSLLLPLLEGKSLGDVLTQVERDAHDPDELQELGLRLGTWFRDWCEQGFFARIETDTSA